MAEFTRPGSRGDFRIAIICALPLEFDAMSLALDQFWDSDGYSYGKTSSDPNNYATGRIGNHDIVLALLSDIGKVRAAVCVGHLRTSYENLQLVILAGICGVSPHDGKGQEILLGDVVIANQVVQYDLGRYHPHGFVPKSSLGRPNSEIRSLLSMLQTEHERNPIQEKATEFLNDIQQSAISRRHQKVYADPGPYEDRLFESSYIHRHDDTLGCVCATPMAACEDAIGASCEALRCDDRYLIQRKRLGDKAERYHRIIVGTVASGDSVIRSGEERDRIASRHNAIAFEMEGAGMWDDVPCILIKSACDYADSHKNKIWQPFAAARAAATVKAVLGRYGAPEKSQTPAPRAASLRSKYLYSWLPFASQRAAEVQDQEELQVPTECDLPSSDCSSHSVDKGQWGIQTRELMDQLSNADWEEHKKRNPPPAKGTCRWILEHPVYREWLQSQKSRLLWISADPGCGKSVLASYLIDNKMGASDPARVNLCYFFFKSDNTDQNHSVTALHCILRQMFEHYPAAARVGLEFISNSKKGFQDVKTLWNAFIQVARNAPQLGRKLIPSTFCILDGLDECDEKDRKELISILSSIFRELDSQVSQENEEGVFKILVLSRPNNAITSGLDRTRGQPISNADSERTSATHSRSAMIRLKGEDETDSISADIARMVDAYVAEFVDRGLPEELLSDIPQRLKSRADRTFLWVALILPLLAEKVETGASRREIDAILDSHDIYFIYSALLDACKQPHKTKKVLSIILAADRPLSTTEMSIALAVTADSDYVKEGEIYPSEATFKDLEDSMVYPFENNIRTLCGNFVRIIHDQIYLVHETAKEFLLSREKGDETPSASLLGSSGWGHSLFRQDCHTVLLHICTAYLWLLGKYSPVSPRGCPSEKTKYFLPYAGRYWASHFRAGRHWTTDDGRTAPYYQNLCHPLFPGFNQWTCHLKEKFILQGRSDDDAQSIILSGLGISKPEEEEDIRDMSHALSRALNGIDMVGNANPTSLKEFGFQGLQVNEMGIVSLSQGESPYHARGVFPNIGLGFHKPIPPRHGDPSSSLSSQVMRRRSSSKSDDEDPTNETGGVLLYEHDYHDTGKIW